MIGTTLSSIVVAPTDYKTAFVDDPENRELVLSTECILATGYHVLPMVTFKGAYHLEKYHANDMDLEIHFDKFIKARIKGRFRMLIFDGCGSYFTQSFLDYCWENNIKPFQFSPHTTHLTQPYGVGYFQKLKGEIKVYLREIVLIGAREITKPDFFTSFEIFSKNTLTENLCRSVFRKARLIPVNPDIVLGKIKDYSGILDEENLGLITSTNDIDSSDNKFTTEQLVKECLHNVEVEARSKQKQNSEGNADKIVLLYGEIHGSSARRSIDQNLLDNNRIQYRRELRMKRKQEKAEAAAVRKEAGLVERGSLNFLLSKSVFDN